MNHHAYYIEDSLSRFEEYKKSINPFWAEKFERFGIGESRELAALASLKNIGGAAIFLIGASSITSEAQQALLKLFEEPQQGSVFILLLPHGSLLPTLRSRMMRYPVQHITKDGPLYNKGPSFVEIAKRFLKEPYKTRSAEIAALLKDDPPRLASLGEAGEGTRERVREFINALEAELYVRLRKLNTKEARAGLEDIAKIRGYLGDKAPALKMLLEHLAATLPQI